jgi:hypothetical protein
MKWPSGMNMPSTHAKVTFSPAWFYRNYGMTFGEKYCSDPIFRTEQDQEAMRLLYERYGSLGLGERDPKPRPHLEICGHRLVPALLGSEIVYQNDQAPSCRQLAVESAEELAAITKPDMLTNRWALEFRRQGDILMDRYGHVDAMINLGGPLNVAANVLGDRAFVHLAEGSPVLKDFLMMIAQVCVDCIDHLTLPYNPHIGRQRAMHIGNCHVMMMSPDTYRRNILPADMFIRQNVGKLALHHCGIMDRYIEHYKSLSPLEYIEVGWGTNIAAIREAFPSTVLDLLINVFDIQNMPTSTLRSLIAKTVNQAQPACYIRDVWIADLGPEVSDRAVVDFVEAIDSSFASNSYSLVP